MRLLTCGLSFRRSNTPVRGFGEGEYKVPSPSPWSNFDYFNDIEGQLKYTSVTGNETTTLPVAGYPGNHRTINGQDQARGEYYSPTPSSTESDGSPHRQVGSCEGTDASTSRRGKEPLYFCEVPGCKSQGFTAKHNYMCRFRLTDTCARLYTHGQFLVYLDHIRAHKGERPFVCSRCKGAFRSRSDLKRHERRDRKKPCQTPDGSPDAMDT